MAIEEYVKSFCCIGKPTKEMPIDSSRTSNGRINHFRMAQIMLEKSYLEAARMNRFSGVPSTPSISVRNWFTTRSVTSEIPAPLYVRYKSYRLGTIDSNSSKKIMEGAHSRARLKRSLMACSDSPIYFPRSSGPLM